MPDDDLERRLAGALHAALDATEPSGRARSSRPARGRRSATLPGGLLVAAAAVLVAVGVVLPRLEAPSGGTTAADLATGSAGTSATMAAPGVPGAVPPGTRGIASVATAEATPPAPADSLPVAPPPPAPSPRAGSAGTGGSGTGTAIVVGTPRIVNIPPNPTEAATHVPVTQGSTLVLTTADAGVSVTVPIGRQIALVLGTGYTWTVNVSPAGILGAGGPFVADQQASWRATAAGTVTISAVGDPACRQSKPACMVPSRLYEWTVIVS